MTQEVVTYREFCNPDLCGQVIAGYRIPELSEFPSMRDNVMAWDPDEKAAVLEYMRSPDYLVAASTSIFKKDVFTGEEIPYFGNLYQDDAGYEWHDYLPYYIEQYNIAVPRHFIDLALASV